MREDAGGQGTPFRAAHNDLDSRFHCVTEMHYNTIAKSVMGRSGPIGLDAKASLHDTFGAVESLPEPTASSPEPEALRTTGTDAIATQSATGPIEIASRDFTQVEYWTHEAPVAQLDRASVYGTEG